MKWYMTDEFDDWSVEVSKLFITVSVNPKGRFSTFCPPGGLLGMAMLDREYTVSELPRFIEETIETLLKGRVSGLQDALGAFKSLREGVTE